MSEVYRLYLEEKRYEKDLKEDTHLQRVAYSKGYTQSINPPKGTNPNTNEQSTETTNR